MKDLIQTDKIAEELRQFWDEVVVENGPRYRDWRNWSDLWIDFWNSLFDMSYTMAHVVGIGLPLWGIVEAFYWIKGLFA